MKPLYIKISVCLWITLMDRELRGCRGVKTFPLRALKNKPLINIFEPCLSRLAIEVRDCLVSHGATRYQHMNQFHCDSGRAPFAARSGELSGDALQRAYVGEPVARDRLRGTIGRAMMGPPAQRGRLVGGPLIAR